MPVSGRVSHSGSERLSSCYVFPVPLPFGFLASVGCLYRVGCSNPVGGSVRGLITGSSVNLADSDCISSRGLASSDIRIALSLSIRAAYTLSFV